MPAIGNGTFALFLAGSLWLALWTGRVRLLGFAPIAVASVALAAVPTPDLLISGDGRNVGITVGHDRLVVLREGRSTFASDSLRELAGLDGDTVVIDDWPGARCTPDFCSIVLERGSVGHVILVGRGRDRVDEMALAAACERSDIVVSERWLPRSCRPRMLKADRTLLTRTGGLSVDLESRSVRTVSEDQGHHGWYRREELRPRYRRGGAPAVIPTPAT
jgi:competence protein ComEC